MSMTLTRAAMIRCAVALFAAGLAAPPALAAPHEHGVATLAIVLDGPRLRVELKLPARDAVGFERRPRTDAERGKVTAVRDRLLDGATLLAPTAAAGCALSGTPEVTSELLASGAPAAPARGGHHHGEEHADFEAVYAFTCSEPAALTSLDQTLFRAFPALRQIRVQAVGPKGPKRATLAPGRPRFAF